MGETLQDTGLEAHPLQAGEVHNRAQRWAGPGVGKGSPRQPFQILLERLHCLIKRREVSRQAWSHCALSLDPSGWSCLFSNVSTVAFWYVANLQWLMRRRKSWQLVPIWRLFLK